MAKPVPTKLPTEAQAAATSVTRAAIEARSISARTMIDGFERELATNPVPQRAGRLHYECARLFESPLGDLAKASEQYQKAHALLSHHLPSVQGARRTLVAQKNFMGSLPLFDAEIRMTSDPRRKALVYFEKGAVLEEMGQKPQAREAYEAGLELDKTDPTLLKVVERVALGAKAWDGLDRTYERAANVFESDPRHRAAVIAERARLAEVRKNDHNSAAELYGLALGTFATGPSPVQALKRLHFNHQRWNDLVTVLEKEAELASDPAARAMALFRVGRIQLDRLGQLEAATSAFERATRETPNDRVILEELARAYEQAKRYSDLASTLERIAQMVPTSLEKVGYYHRIGQIHEERTNEETLAIEWYERALAAEKSYLPAIQALAKLYVRAQRWESLIAVHSGEAEGSLDVERRAAAHARIADVYETKLGRPELATQHHSRALGLVPGYEPSFKSLSRLLTQAGRFTELVELYERAVDGAHDAETKITYLFKIGRLHEDSLGDFSSAVTAYRRILDVDAHHLGAIHAVQRAAERAGRHKELMSALELEAGHVTDKKRRLEILHRAGEVAEVHLADDQLALATYKKVSELDKNYTPVLASLGRLYYRLGRWEDLLETYRSELRLAPKGSAAAALHYKMGELYEERIGKDEEAIAAFRRAVEADPFHSPSLSALTRKLAERGRWEELVKLLELELSGSKDAEVRARTAFRVGEIYENRLRQPEKALGAYEQALAADSDFRPARDGRIRLLSDARDHKRLVEELEKEANAARDPIMAVTALFRAGEVFRDEMNDPVRAIAAFEKVIERDPAHLEAMLALEPLYAERGAWEELSKTYSAEARVLADPRARVAALRELARLMERRGSGSAEQIQETYFAIMQLAPDDLGALLALERLALREQDARLMAHVDVKLGSVFEDASLVSAHLTRLAELLEAGGDPGALDVFRVALARDATNLAAARGLSRLAERRGDPALFEEAAGHEASVTLDRAQAARLLVRAGEIRADHAESDAATRLFERALELYPDHEPAAARLRDLRLSRGEVERLISALTQAAGAAQKERSLQLWMTVAELYADRKRDLPAALAALGRANNLAPNHVGTLLRLGDYFARDSQWQQAAERWRQATLQGGSDDVKIEAHLRLAAVLDEHLDDPTRALASVEAVLAVDPNHRGALDRLLSLLLRKGDHDKAAETAARLIKVSPGIAERVDAQTKLGRLERKRGRTGAAAQAYEEAVALAGLEGDAARELLELVREKPRRSDSPTYASYAGALSRFVEQARGNDPKLVPVFTELSRVYGDELKQPDQAVVALERGLAIYPDPTLFEELGLRLSAAGQHQRAIPALYRALETDVRRERAFRKLAEAYEALGRPVEAQLALVPLGALGLANDFERASLSARRPRPALGGPRSFDTAMLDSLSIVPVPDAATNLLAVLADGLGKVYQPDLERYGLSARDRISAKSGHPLRQLCDRVAQIFGVSDYDLYTHQYPSPGVEVELGDPVAVLVPPMFGTLSEPQQVFLLSRVFANIARRLSVVDRLDAQEIELLLAAGARIVVPNFGHAKDEDYLNQLARKVSRSLPWIGRGAIEDAAREYAAQDKFDAVEWLERQRIAATRAALVVGDDLIGSVALIQQHPTALGVEPGRLMPELVRFWASEPALTLRKRLSML